MLTIVVIEANSCSSNRWLPTLLSFGNGYTSFLYMKNIERTGGQIAYSSAGTNRCCSVQTSAGISKKMYLLRTRQLKHYTSRYIFGRIRCLEIILTAFSVGKWPSISSQACSPSLEMMNTIHTVWTGKRLVTRAPSGDERTNTENSDLMRYIARSTPLPPEAQLTRC